MAPGRAAYSDAEAAFARTELARGRWCRPGRWSLRDDGADRLGRSHDGVSQRGGGRYRRGGINGNEDHCQALQFREGGRDRGAIAPRPLATVGAMRQAPTRSGV